MTGNILYHPAYNAKWNSSLVVSDMLAYELMTIDVSYIQYIVLFDHQTITFKPRLF